MSATRALSILIYHRVLWEQDGLLPSVPDTVLFERHMRWLRQFFNVLPLEDAISRLRAGRLPPRAAAITFDDGYLDNVEVALPVLQRLGLHATFFIATEFLNGECMWNDRVIEAVRRIHVGEVDLGRYGGGRHILDGSENERAAAIEGLLRGIKHLPPEQREAAVAEIESRADHQTRRLMMSESDVRGLAQAGMGIGAHTVTHPILTMLSDDASWREIEDSRTHLREVSGDSVRLFAYPNGQPGQDYDERHVAMVRDAGFDAALSTVWGAATQGDDPLQLPRFTPWDRSAPRFVLRLAWMRGNGRFRADRSRNAAHRTDLPTPPPGERVR